ncbi:AAA family ATPase [Roseomonas hellenica]|uniref:AAA family ATPase n=1 Tax=Plastoroseomonas hellenica TaxID=2687306 RepID=A0ABS5F0H7_9PROT|nr:adenylate/guanylate cyclase domain-containing protein [Plastoroseomonas hellenica]MBR0666059.1 AAA family ATPase [Plastoroseomonas hellenica]
MRFCGACGVLLRRAPDRPAMEAGERRPVTVLFADIVGSSALAAQLDPEDLRRVLLGFRTMASDIVTRHRGSLAQHQGDGLLARFGFPRAREDDAQRALRAALEISAGVTSLHECVDVALQVRVAVHSGITVVATLGGGAAGEPGAMVGETTTIAARLQQAATPGEVWASEATRRLAGPRFSFSSRGEIVLRGLPRPVLAHRLDGEFATVGAAPVLSMVNRVRELRSLFAAWRDAEAGAGTTLLIEGEPGMGKSRLIAEFRARLGPAGEGAVCLGCGADDGGSAFRPLINWLATTVGLSGPVLSGRDALVAWLEGRGLAATEHVAPLAALLDCATPEELAELQQAGRRRRRRSVAALLAALRASASGPTQLFIAEDIHWADDSTLAVLRALGDACGAPGASLLLLLSRRTEGRNLAGAPPLTLRLAPLTEAEARQLATAAAPPGTEASLVGRIVERAGGVPIFLEEAAREIEAGAELPLTLRAALTSRLDALSEAKQTAQLAAVLGRTFSLEMIEALALAVAAPPPRRALRRLVEAGLLEPEGPAEAPSGYAFRHELIRETAYETLLRSRRATLHRAIAKLLGERTEARMDLVAFHLAAGGQTRDAVIAYERAAADAAAASAHVEAAAHCRAALALLPKLADDTARSTAEARLNIALATQITVARGNAVPEVGKAYTRAHAAALRLGDDRLRIRTLRGLQTFHLVRGAIAEGHEIGERIMALMAEETDLAARVQAHRPFGLGLLYLGRFQEAEEHLRRTLDFYDPARDAPQRFDYGSDPAVLAWSHLAWVLWFMGKEAAAWEADAAALLAARELGHAHSLCFALAFRCALAQFADRPAESLAAALELQATATSQDFTYWSAWGAIFEGWARARGGELTEGEAVLRRGLEDYAATGAELMRPCGLGLLADILPDGRAEEARQLMAEADALLEAGSIFFSRPVLAMIRQRHPQLAQ